jgi:hypothetical protein
MISASGSDIELAITVETGEIWYEADERWVKSLREQL